MVLTPEEFTDNSPIPPSQSVTVKYSSARKSLHQFSESFDIKPKTDVLKFCADRSKQNAIISVSMLWSGILKRWVHSKINQQVKKALYDCILQHHQVLQFPIANFRFRLSIEGQSETQLVPKTLLHVLVIELNNSIFSPPYEGVFKERINADNIIIINYSTLRNILPPQMKKVSDQHKVM